MEYTLNIKKCDICNLVLKNDGITIHFGVRHLDVCMGCFFEIEKLLKKLHEDKLDENLLNRRS